MINSFTTISIAIITNTIYITTIITTIRIISITSISTM